MNQPRFLSNRAALNVLLRSALFVLAIFLISSCDGNYLVWSPDGKLGAIVGAKGLRACDGDGNVSALLLAKAGMFRWLPQGHQGLVVGYDYVNKWAELKPLLSKDLQDKIANDSARLRNKILTYHGEQKKFAENALRTLDYPLEATLLLHAGAGSAFDRTALRKWPAYNSVKVPVFFIKQAQLDQQQVRLSRLLDRGIDEIVELRPSPNGKFLLVVKHEKEFERNYIEVLSLSGTTQQTMPLTFNTNSYPDWSTDSRFIYYTRANHDSEPDLLKGHGVHEGGVFKLEIADASGKLLTNTKEQRLANVVFDNRAPLRCLKDGRVLFTSREIRLPSSVNSPATAALFILDGNRVDTVMRRNDDVAFFEPNPEQDSLAIALGGGGALIVSKINGADPIELCNGKDLRLSGILPQWKSNLELSYGTELPSPRGGKPSYSVILWTRGGNIKELSKSWTKDANAEISIRRDYFQDAMTGVMEDIDRNSGSN